jgi:hypothetical protein
MRDEREQGIVPSGLNCPKQKPRERKAKYGEES